ncbi:MAG: hypothetical protein ACNA7O_12125 [Rhodobacterales bacterium]
MSHSENNMERQKRRHKGPLIGFSVLGIFVVGLIVWWLNAEFSRSDGPEGAPVQIDGRTGDQVEGSGDAPATTGATPETGVTPTDDPSGDPIVAPQPQMPTPTD